MRITVIPDVHGTHHWEEAVKERADRIVFLGDYVDSSDSRQPDQMENLQAILDFGIRTRARVTVVLGYQVLAYLSDP